MTRHELEDAVWELPHIKNSSIDFSEIEAMSDDRLLELLNGTKRISQRSRKHKSIKWYLTNIEYVERNSELWRIETFSNGWQTDQRLRKCAQRVLWRGKHTSASILLHYLRTGELVQRVPKAHGLKPYRAVVRLGDRVKHLGYYSSKEERDEAVALAKMGILPTG